MKVSILQWNIWYKEDIHNIVKFLQKNPADIICLQELTRNYHTTEPETIQYIAKSLGYNYHFQEIVLDDERWTQANGIFTRFPITSGRSQWINEPIGSGSYDDEYRAYIEVTIEAEGKKLEVGTTHMSYTRGFENNPCKEQETDKLASIVADKKRNFILTGDFNASPDSPTIQKISDKLKNIGPSMTENSWTTKPFSYDGFEESGLNWRLDYIFSTPDIKAVTAEILKTEYSDHLPVFARLELV
jgi:endonuclease/exonuclease/phosphatase family metal-dependent hydrolase